MEEAIIEALQKGKASFSQSDFLVRRQEDYEAADYPEVNWAPPREEHNSRMEGLRELPRDLQARTGRGVCSSEGEEMPL